MNFRAILSTAAAATAGAMLATTPAAAESVEAPIDLADWDYEALYASGFSAERFMNADVYGENGDVVGEIEDLVVNPDGQVTHAIIETDAFLDLGDRHVQYPLDLLEIRDTDNVVAPFDEGRLEEYTLFPAVDDRPIHGRKWRISELIGDYAYLEQATAYGYVEDVIISNGEVASVIVSPDIAYADTDYGDGPYAFPYYGYDSDYGFDPGLDVYSMPYTVEDVPTVTFDSGALQGSPTDMKQG